MKHSLFQIEDYSNELVHRSFEFFFWFSRFEYALKENNFLKKGPFEAALPDWEKFKDQYSDIFQVTCDVAALFDQPPQRQIYTNGQCEWEETNLNREKTDLGKSILILKTIRNNLFHGGKGGQKDWDEPSRNLFLLIHGLKLLDMMAEVGDLLADYRRRY